MVNHFGNEASAYWKFCPKCKLRLYRITKKCSGIIYMKCWRCREILLIDLAKQPR